MQNLEPHDNPFLEKRKCRRERKKEKKTPLIVDTYFCDSARKPIGPTLNVMLEIFTNVVSFNEDEIKGLYKRAGYIANQT